MRARRCFQLFHFVSICVRAVYLQEVARRAHFLAMREAEVEVERYGSFLRLLLPAKTVRMKGAYALTYFRNSIRGGWNRQLALVRLL